MTTARISTPNYVLIEGKHRIGPHVEALESGLECLTIYGFSDKGPYDRFLAKSELALTPYPLVKGYLRNQMEEPGERLRLVVVDAESPRQRCLSAATFKDVLEAQERSAQMVIATYRAVFNDRANAYRIHGFDGDLAEAHYSLPNRLMTRRSPSGNTDSD